MHSKFTIQPIELCDGFFLLIGNKSYLLRCIILYLEEIKINIFGYLLAKKKLGYLIKRINKNKKFKI